MKIEIRDALEVARSLSEACQSAADSIRQLNGKLGLEGPENARPIIEKVEESRADFCVAAVDSGVVAATLRFLDIVAIRPAGVIFEYRGGRLFSHRYIPSKTPGFVVKADGGLDYGEVAARNSLCRLIEEMGLALRIAKEESADGKGCCQPGMILIDGSLVPLVSDRPAKDSRIGYLYGMLVEKYRELFSVCRQKGICLVGFSKDSRGRRFVEAIRSSGVPLPVLDRIGDVQLFSSVLGEAQRTVALPYAANPKEHPILEDFGEFGDKIRVYYQRIWEHAPVYRIEYLDFAGAQACGSEFLDSIAARIAFMCKAGKKFPYPPVLIEADMAAAAGKAEAGILEMEIGRATGAAKKVRDERPFR
ncbi:DNA double-strand break repair nuclease NurA [Candidatus Parvarchaeota archaeon]|nr:DNA double-strand break repair nuclease NurA [Candidatus Parvarchaeota archaeon]